MTDTSSATSTDVRALARLHVSLTHRPITHGHLLQHAMRSILRDPATAVDMVATECACTITDCRLLAPGAATTALMRHLARWYIHRALRAMELDRAEAVRIREEVARATYNDI